MHSYTLIISTVLGAAINAILLPAKTSNSLVDEYLFIDTADMQQPIPLETLPQILTPLMKEQPFKDAYDISLRWKPDHVNPVDREELNPLALHNAKLDDQYALTKWLQISPSPKKCFILKKLLENPTVDFKIGNNIALKCSLKDGDVDNFKILFDKLEIKLTDRVSQELVLNAAIEGNLEILKYLLDKKKVPIKSQILLNTDTVPTDVQIQFEAVMSGKKDVVKYLLEDYTLPDGSKLVINQYSQLLAARLGNKEILKYLLEDCKLPDQSRLKFKPLVLPRAAESGSKELMKYLLEEYKLPDGTKLLPHKHILKDAAESGSIELVDYLLLDYTLPDSTRLQRDPWILLNAAKSGNLSLVRYLLEAHKARIPCFIDSPSYTKEIREYLKDTQRKLRDVI